MQQPANASKLGMVAERWREEGAFPWNSEISAKQNKKLRIIYIENPISTK